MVNPEARVLVEWINSWDDRKNTEIASEKLTCMGADIISHHDTLSNREFSSEYGVYSVLCGEDGNAKVKEYIAAPVWNWGIFYEKMLRSLMNRKPMGSEQKVINFWWGMDSGIVDFFYSKRLVPRETQKLLDLMKNMIVNGVFHPFTGPIYNQNGELMVAGDQLATREQIVGMDWFVDIVESELPDVISEV